MNNPNLPPEAQMAQRRMHAESIFHPSFTTDVHFETTYIQELKIPLFAKHMNACQSGETPLVQLQRGDARAYVERLGREWRAEQILDLLMTT